MTLAIEWRSDRPERLVERLAAALGVRPTPPAEDVADGRGWAFGLPSGTLTVLPADRGREHPFRVVTGGPIDDGRAPGPRGPDLGAIGWATVETDRAAAELDVDLSPLPPDELLAATAARAVPRGVMSVGSDALTSHLILLEPSTEGRIAAGLARFGEGPVVLYIVGSGAGGSDPTTRTAPGPFGRQALIADGPWWGPFLVVGDRFP